MFFVIILVLLTTAYGYPAWRLQSALDPMPWIAWLWTAATVIAALLPIAVLAILRRADTPARWHRPVAWITYLCLGGTIILFDVVLLRDLCLGAFWLLERLITVDLALGQRTQLLTLTAGLCPIVAFVIAAVGVHLARRRPPIHEVTIDVADLPPDLEGLRIAHISDLHVGATIRRPFVDAIVDAVQGLRPDLIAFTGDLADGTVIDLASEVAPFARLSAPMGVWCCTGNHEYYSDPQAWMEKIDDLGMHRLSNSHEVIRRGDACLVVGGLPDPTGAEMFPNDPRHTPNPNAVFNGAPEEGVRLLLAHQPAAAVSAAQTKAALTLSGHTHGGQIFPWHLLVPLQQPIVAGLRHRAGGDGWIYVTSGAGYWGPPMRFGASSEIACLTLRRALS